jgi:hypothetical protein
VDYKIHTHATYAVCDAADAFQAAPAYTRKLASDKAKQAEQVGRCGLGAGLRTGPLHQVDRNLGFICNLIPTAPHAAVRHCKPL